MGEHIDLREVQRPIRQAYRADPGKAKLTLRATGSEASGGALACSIDIGRAIIEAQAHAGVGGPGTAACSGDLLLGSLAACAQITAQMVAEALGLSVDAVEVTIEGDLDLRGTLGLSPNVPTGFQELRATFKVTGDLTSDQLEALQMRTERACVVLATLTQPPPIHTRWETST